MKELKNRIKGLSAILLAVSLALCLVVRFSGANVSAEIAEVIIIDASVTEGTTDNGYSVKYAIDNKFVTSSLSITGGMFVIDAGNDKIEGNISYEHPYSYNGTNYYSSASINNDGSQYSGFMITAGSYEEVGEYKNKYYSFTVQFVKEPEYVSNTAVGAIGVGTYYLTRRNEYSFSGTGTYKVQGDPTVYQFKEFCVPSDGTYTILLTD